MEYIAFIGSREWEQFTETEQQAYHAVVKAAVGLGYGVVTGGARGCDQIAIARALLHGGQVLVVLPWENYESEWLQQIFSRFSGRCERLVYNPKVHQAWTESVLVHHGNPHVLSRGAFAMHARNFGIVERAVEVVALPSKEKSWGGGTGQGVRIARALGKPVWYLTTTDQRRECLERFSGSSGKE